MAAVTEDEEYLCCDGRLLEALSNEDFPVINDV